MKQTISVRLPFVDAYDLEITEDGEFLLTFNCDPVDDWTCEQFRAEARDIGRALFAGLPVTWVAFDDVAPGVRADFYRAEVALEDVLRVVYERAASCPTKSTRALR